MRFAVAFILPAFIPPALGGFYLYDRIARWRENSCDFGFCGVLTMGGGNVHIVRNGVGTCDELLSATMRIPLDNVDSSIVRGGPKTVPSFCNAPGPVTFKATNNGNNIEISTGGNLIGTCSKAQPRQGIPCYDSTTNFGLCATLTLGTPQTYCKMHGIAKFNCANVPLC